MAVMAGRSTKSLGGTSSPSLLGDSDIMSVQLFVLRPNQHQPALNMAGTQMTVLASNAATQSYGITLQQGEEGAGRPPIRHD